MRPAKREAQDGRGKPELTVEAASALDKSVWLEWGSKEGSGTSLRSNIPRRTATFRQERSER